MNTRTEKKPAQWINKYSNKIDLEPFFQRGSVWPDWKQQYFIDSVLKKWGVPKIFLWKTGEDEYACLDGKQRLTSLFRFVSGELPLNEKYSKGFGGKKYPEMTILQQDEFDKYEFDVEVVEAPEEEVIELYKRLQGGTPLNFGEKLFAMSGNMNEFVKARLSKAEFFTKNVSLTNTRYSHYGVCAQLCLLSMKSAKEDLKYSNIESLFINYAAFNTSSPEAKKILDVIKTLGEVFPNEHEPALRNRPSVVSMFYLVSELTARGSIAGHENELGDFFRDFVEEVKQEFEKKPEDRDAELLSYQSAVTQGADKIKSIMIRHKVLLKRLSQVNQFFSDLINPPSPRDKFRDAYVNLQKKVGISSVSGLDEWLITNQGIKNISCPKVHGNKQETIAGHVRNCIGHAEHGTFTPKELDEAMKIVERFL